MSAFWEVAVQLWLLQSVLSEAAGSLHETGGHLPGDICVVAFSLRDAAGKKTDTLIRRLALGAATSVTFNFLDRAMIAPASLQRVRSWPYLVLGSGKCLRKTANCKQALKR